MAVPSAVSWAVARRLMSVQWGGASVQKLTWPGVMGEPLVDVTVAVRVTAVPCLTVATGAPAEVMARVVAVGLWARADGAARQRSTRAVRAVRSLGVVQGRRGLWERMNIGVRCLGARWI